MLPYWPVFWSLIWSPATAHRRTTDDGCTPNSVRDVLAVVSSAGNSWPRWRWEDSGLRGGGAVFPAAPRRAGRRVSGRAAAGRRRARGCARCGLRLGYQLYRIIAVPITYWYLYSITLYPGAGSLFTFARTHGGTALRALVLVGSVFRPPAAAGAPRRSGGSAVRSGARGAVPLLCGLGYAATTCVAVAPRDPDPRVPVLVSCAVEIPATRYRMFGRASWCGPTQRLRRRAPKPLVMNTPLCGVSLCAHVCALSEAVGSGPGAASARSSPEHLRTRTLRAFEDSCSVHV